MTDMSATAAQSHSATPGQSAPQGEAAGPGPDEALASAHAVARQRAEAGDLTGARTLLEDAVTTGELRLGRDHPRLVPLMVDLATIARNLGNLTEAQAQLRRAYAIIVISGGPEHATSLSVEGRLAAITYRLGEPTEAYDWHLADVGSRVLGDDHPAVRGAQQRLSGAPSAAPEPEPDGPPVEAGRVPVPAPPPDFTEHGFGSTYAPAPNAPGVYQRQSQAQNFHVAEPPPRDFQDVEVWQEPPRSARAPAPAPARRRTRGNRSNRGGIALVASLGVAAFVAAAIAGAQLFLPRRGPATNASVPPVTTAPAQTTTASPVPPPTGVTLEDEGGSITLTWLDPGDGQVPFIVAGARVGALSAPLETVPAGRTTSTIYGLNDRYDYCFTVAAVWSSDMIVPSMRTCTHRLSTGDAS